MHLPARILKICKTNLQMVSLMAIVWIGFPESVQAASRSMQIKHNELTLNGKLITPNKERKGSRIVPMLHGTLAHHGMEIITECKRR